jgi:hypothetical protein
MRRSFPVRRRGWRHRSFLFEDDAFPKPKCVFAGLKRTPLLRRGGSTNLQPALHHKHRNVLVTIKAMRRSSDASIAFLGSFEGNWRPYVDMVLDSASRLGMARWGVTVQEL